MADAARQWPMKDARAKFSELVDRAHDDGPQIVTRNGKPTVVVVSIEEWDRRKRLRGDLVELPLHNSPANVAPEHRPAMLLTSRNGW